MYLRPPETTRTDIHFPYTTLFLSGYNGINPYALGFGMMTDIERICTDPTEEDREWFPDIAGSKEPMEVLKHIWANYRDESFIAQFLSPHLIRNWRLFHLVADEDEPALRVDAIHTARKTVV